MVNTLRKGVLFLGIAMLLVGGYLFAQSMIMITTGFMDLDWITWTLDLTIGILLVSFGPGVIVWAYVKDYQDSYSSSVDQTVWQVIQIPSACSSCGNEIEIHSIEWIGPNEARCSFCSNTIEVRTGRY